MQTEWLIRPFNPAAESRVCSEATVAERAAVRRKEGREDFMR